MLYSFPFRFVAIKVCGNDYNMRTRDAPGLLAPVIPVRGLVGDKELEEVVGGPYGNIIEWSESVDLHIEPMSDADFQSEIGAKAVVMELVAKSFDNQRRDIHTFVLDTSGSTQPEDEGRKPKQEGEDGLSRGSGFDVAKCKPAIQSSTIESNVAGNALAGGMDDLAHTDCEDSPWWMVDLFETRAISSVVVKNRQDCCQERLDGVLVELLDEGDRTLASMQHSPGVDGPIGDQWTASFENGSARKVRVSIQKEGGQCEFLNLASVQVFSAECTARDSCEEERGCAYGNVALCKPATQSSTIDTGRGFAELGLDAMHAVDGSQLLSHTECEQAPWWELDLLSDRPVTQVIIKNREDCCFDRLDGLLVELFNERNQLTGLFRREWHGYAWLQYLNII